MIIFQVTRNNTLAFTAALLLIGIASAASAAGPIFTIPGDSVSPTCNMIAKQCPDGSFVGPTGPNCAFNCPNGESPAVRKCSIVTCAAPPAGCRYIPDDTLNDDGCPANSCGILDCSDILTKACPLATCIAPPAGCTTIVDPTLNANGCLANPCGDIVCQAHLPTVVSSSNDQFIQSDNDSSQAKQISPGISQVNQTSYPIHQFVNFLYRATHLGQNPTIGQNRYWLSRISDKPTLGALYGAMQWQVDDGLDNSL